MQGYLLGRPRDPLARKLASHCELLRSPSAVSNEGNNALPPPPRAELRVWVFQARQLAVRPLFEPMYARHGLQTRVYLVRGRSERRVPVGRVHESTRNAGGSMRHPVWRRHRLEDGGGFRLPLVVDDEEEDDVSLVVEVVCGILVVATASVPLGEFLARPTRREELQAHWTPLEGGDGGLIELALEFVPLEEAEEEEEEEEELPVGASAWEHKQARESGNNRARGPVADAEGDLGGDEEEDKDPDEPTAEYSSSSSDEQEEAASRYVDLQQDETALEVESSREDGSLASQPAEEDAEERQWRRVEAARRTRLEIPPGRVKDVTVARAGGTTMYIPHQTAAASGGSLPLAGPAVTTTKKKKKSRCRCSGREKEPPASEQDRLMDKQLWDLYVFGIADRAPACHHPGDSSQEEADEDEDDDGDSDRDEEDEEQTSTSALEASVSFFSRAASTCASDVLAYNEFIQDMEAAITQERLGKQQQQGDDNQEDGGAVVGVGWSQAEPEETAPPSSSVNPNAAARPSPVPVRRRAPDPSPRPRGGVVLFDPASLPLPLAPESLALRQQQRRRSVMAGASADAERAQAQAQGQGARRRSLPINAVYAQLQRKLLAGVNAMRRQPDKQSRGDKQQAHKPSAPTTATATTPELGRKRSMSLHAYTDLFAPPAALELVDPDRHRSNSNGNATARSSSSGASSSLSSCSSDPARSPSPFGAALSSRRGSAGSGAVVVLQGEPLRVGRRILVGRSALGVVRYIGPVLFAPGAWVGVELVEPKGKHDGAVDGVRYFSCARHHGILLRANRLDLRLL